MMFLASQVEASGSLEGAIQIVVRNGVAPSLARAVPPLRLGSIMDDATRVKPQCEPHPTLRFTGIQAGAAS